MQMPHAGIGALNDDVRRRSRKNRNGVESDRRLKGRTILAYVPKVVAVEVHVMRHCTRSDESHADILSRPDQELFSHGIGLPVDHEEVKIG
jgi:hypothetical protein